MATDMDRQRASNELEVSRNTSNFEAVHFLAVWHLERQSFQHARQYFTHLTTLRPNDPHIWVALSICCAMSQDFAESQDALDTAANCFSLRTEDIRVLFCKGLLAQSRKDVNGAFELYTRCWMICDKAVSKNSPLPDSPPTPTPLNTYAEIRGETLLRIAILRKDTGAYDIAMQLCDQVCSEVASTSLSTSIGTSALCLKGLLHEIRTEFPLAEVVYQSALQLVPGHSLALERLGRVYLRYRETIPAAVQCFFKAVETNSSSNVAWYLLGRCYSATGQFADAREAYNRSVNINPNDANVWCSLGVLYYTTGQYREALGMLSRAVKLNPTLADAWHNIGTLYEICGQIEDAQLAYNQARKFGIMETALRPDIASIAAGPISFVPTSVGDKPSTTSSIQHQFDAQSIQSGYEHENFPVQSIQEPIDQINSLGMGHTVGSSAVMTSSQPVTLADGNSDSSQ